MAPWPQRTGTAGSHPRRQGLHPGSGHHGSGPGRDTCHPLWAPTPQRLTWFSSEADLEVLFGCPRLSGREAGPRGVGTTTRAASLAGDFGRGTNPPLKGLGAGGHPPLAPRSHPRGRELMGGFWGARPGHPNSLPPLAASRHGGLSAAAATLPVVPGSLEPIQPRTVSGPPWLPLPGSLGCPQPPPTTQWRPLAVRAVTAAHASLSLGWLPRNCASQDGRPLLPLPQRL